MRNLIVLSVAAMLAGPALAAPDPAAVAAARVLAQQTDVRGQVSSGMARLIADMRSGNAVTRLLATQPGFAMARSRNPAKFEEVLKRVGALQAGVAEKVVAQQLPAVVEATVQSYATHYTAAELRQLAEFYRSPLGKALSAKQPRVMGDINRATAELIAQRIQASMKNIQPQVEAELKRLQPAPPPAKP